MASTNYIFYKKAYDKYGISAKGLCWYSKQTQYSRFNIITSYLKDIENSSLIDIGCGFGDYILFLKEKKIKPEIYIGIDCEEFMIDICKKRFENETFLKLDILKNKIPSADYLICSGTLNILNKEDFLKAIEICYKVSKKAFIFNFLTKGSLHKLEIEQIATFCKGFCKKVSIEKEYLNNDSTFLLEK